MPLGEIKLCPVVPIFFQDDGNVNLVLDLVLDAFFRAFLCGTLLASFGQVCAQCLPKQARQFVGVVCVGDVAVL